MCRALVIVMSVVLWTASAISVGAQPPVELRERAVLRLRAAVELAERGQAAEAENARREARELMDRADRPPPHVPPEAHQLLREENQRLREENARLRAEDSAQLRASVQQIAGLLRDLARQWEQSTKRQATHTEQLRASVQRIASRLEQTARLQADLLDRVTALTAPPAPPRESPPQAAPADDRSEVGDEAPAAAAPVLQRVQAIRREVEQLRAEIEAVRQRLRGRQ